MGSVSSTKTSSGVPWASYLALGDSFTEGLWDPYPQFPDRQRGWADILAARLAERRRDAGEDPLRYANLAIRGRKLRAILAEQLPRAVEMKPDLVSLIGGGNDFLRAGTDADVLARNLEHAVVRLREAGIDVLLGTGVDVVDSPLIKVTRGRVAIYNATIWSIARRHGAYVLDQWGMRSLMDWRMWSDDHIHLTPEGHRRVAQAALVGLDLEPDDPEWDDPLTPLPPTPAIDRAKQNALWMRNHVLPWAGRHLRGRSTGDDRLPKWPELVEFPLAAQPPVVDSPVGVEPPVGFEPTTFRLQGESSTN